MEFSPALPLLAKVNITKYATSIYPSCSFTIYCLFDYLRALALICTLYTNTLRSLLPVVYISKIRVEYSLGP